MSDKKCFLDNCNATVGDCKNTNCKCLICMGADADKCETLRNERKSQMQQMICENCKNHKCM